MATGKSLQLTRQNDFFTDPFFQDIWSNEEASGLKNKLNAIKQKGLLAKSGRSKGEAAHNLQVSATNDLFIIQLELPGFSPEDFVLKTKEDLVILEAIHKPDDSEDGATGRSYVKEFNMPKGVIREQLSSSYSGNGILTISAPRAITAPEGVDVEEAMSSTSAAFTTEDGASVQQASDCASQQLATSTQSTDEHGTTTMSSSFQSSSSSSSTLVSSSSGFGGGMDFGMPSITGFGNMDDMMKDMMVSDGGNGMSLGSGLSKMSSSSFSSSSQQQSTNSSSRMLGNGQGDDGLMKRLNMDDFMNTPSMGSMLDKSSFGVGMGERMKAAESSNGSKAMSHKVKPTGDYVDNKKEADHTVLLKVKEGNEYKLVLNMQQYAPENIVVKLNDKELVINASDGASEDFTQKHIIPDGIDVEKLTSSFSSDGILVIKAPKRV